VSSQGRLANSARRSPLRWARLAAYLAGGEHYLVGQIINPNAGMI
jgi:hypothetical protein